MLIRSKPNSRRGIICRLILLALLMPGVGWWRPGDLRGGEREFPEYQLKSAFLFNFAKFVTWPREAFASPQSPFIIGILGEDPFGKFLEQTIEGKKLNERTLALKHFKSVEEAANCQVLFISRSEQERFPAILNALRKQSTLTVSEVQKFAQRGGMINFVIMDGSVRFEINLPAAEEAGLQISSKLCTVGILVKTVPEKESK